MREFGPTPDCRACQAGALIQYNWPMALRPDDDLRGVADALAPAEPLRWGQLFRCRVCDQPWLLDARGQAMAIVPDGRLPLVLAWNRAPIALPDRVRRTLEAIGGVSPPVTFRPGYRETPCGVVTKSGERIDVALVCIQREPPIEVWRQPRLADDIAEVYESPYALPRDVRIAAAQAEEMRMGFAPTLIRMPDGRRFCLNGSANFLVRPPYRAAEARLDPALPDLNRLPELPQGPDPVCFVADR